MKAKVYTFNQGEMCVKKLGQLTNIVDKYGGLFRTEPGLLKKAYKAMGWKPVDAIFAMTQALGAIAEAYVASTQIFTKDLNNERHGEFNMYLANQYANRSDDMYPNLPNDALRLGLTLLPNQSME